MSLEEFETKQKEIWREWYLVIQGFFYFAQGVAFAALLYFPVIMTEFLTRPNGDPIVSDDAITYQFLIMIPWYIKLLYGLLSDNVSFKKLGRRKPYILIAGLFGLIGWFVLPTFTIFNAGFIIVGLILSLSIALSDAVIDSLAVDITPPKRRGWMQGVGWGGRGAGTAIAGLIFYFILNDENWSIAFYMAGALVVIACIVAMAYREPKILDSTKITSTSWQDYKVELKKGDTWLVTLFMLISGSGIALVSTLTTFLNNVTSIDLGGIGLGITFFALGQFVGASLIGILGDFLPLFLVISVSTVTYIGGIISFMFIPYTNITIVYVIVGIIGALNGGYEATQMRIGMEYSQGPIGGSLYNWYMSVSNIGQIGLGSIVIAQLVDPLGGYEYSMQFASAFLLLALIPGFFLIRKIIARRKELALGTKNQQKTKEEKEEELIN
ncbi:MAG: MFS transporter [Asgard group archaeon]|nr:MFS transporter [Asgard group archaeon]